jgi:hypothetical protein
MHLDHCVAPWWDVTVSAALALTYVDPWGPSARLDVLLAANRFSVLAAGRGLEYGSGLINRVRQQRPPLPAAVRASHC